MPQHEFNQKALEQKARSERLYLHYALTLATLLFLMGVALTVLGAGGHLDIVISGGGMEARFVNATPGIAMTVIGAAIFVMSKPRRLSVKHGSTRRTDETWSAASIPDSDEKAERELEVLTEAARLQEEREFDELTDYLKDNRDVLTGMMGPHEAEKLIRLSMIKRLRGKMEVTAYIEEPTRPLPPPPKPGETIAQVAARLRTHAAEGAAPATAQRQRVTVEEERGHTLYQRVPDSQARQLKREVENLKGHLLGAKARRLIAQKNGHDGDIPRLDEEIRALETQLEAAEMEYEQASKAD